MAAADTDADPGQWPAGPVSERERILTLDALRGVAILGVLVANVLTFAFPMWTSTGESSGPVRLLVGLIVEGKFYVLFAILFGMGLALQSSRAERAAVPFRRVYARRLAALLLFGIAHGVLFYSGDILAFYAVLALMAFSLRHLRPRRLLAVAAALFALNLTVIGAYALFHPETPNPGLPDWQRLADERRAELGVAGGMEAASEPVADWRLEILELMADEARIAGSGSWWEVTRLRTAAFVSGWGLRMAFTFWRVLAFFLLGIYFVRRSVFLETGRYRSRYRTWFWTGLVVGVVLQGTGAAAQMAGGPAALFALAMALILGGGLIQSLAYASGVALLCSWTWGQRLLRPVAAVGRMALTNYLLGSIVFGLVFHGYGLGLFGRIGAGGAVSVALALYAAELIASPLWLRRFRFGPFEWLWRSITYGRLQPLSSPSPRPPST